MFFGRVGGEKSGCAGLRNTVAVLASRKFPARLQKSKVLHGNGLCEWSVVVLAFPDLHPVAHQPVITNQLEIPLCSQTFLSALCSLIFFDFCDLEKMLTKALKAWG